MRSDEFTWKYPFSLNRHPQLSNVNCTSVLPRKKGVMLFHTCDCALGCNAPILLPVVGSSKYKSFNMNWLFPPVTLKKPIIGTGM